MDKHKILFVCLGNICRSPAAQGIFQAIVDGNNRSRDFLVDSAGTYSGHQGELPDRRMRNAASARGYSLTHRSRPVTLSDFFDFDLIIAMDERGKDLTTEQFAQKVRAWRDAGESLCFIIGGADGLDPQLKSEARMMLRLSSMTLPHAMARVMLAEQIYRAFSILTNHPYHRA